MTTYGGVGGIASWILDLGTRWRRWVVSFTLRRFYPRGKSPQYQLYRKLGGVQSRTGRYGEEKFSSPCRESNPHYLAATSTTHMYVGLYSLMRDLRLSQLWIWKRVCSGMWLRVSWHPEDGDSRPIRNFNFLPTKQNKQIWRLLLLGYLGGSLMTLIVIHVNLDSVSDVSEVHSASIFRTEMGRLSENTKTARTSETSALHIANVQSPRLKSTYNMKIPPFRMWHRVHW
jgi:hypothetical protein